MNSHVLTAPKPVIGSPIEWDFDYAVVRLGQVGLWIALNCHAAGNRVLGLDSSAARLVSIGAGLVDLSPRDRERLVVALVGPGFQLAVDLDLVSRARIVIVCVPTSGGGRLMRERMDLSTSQESIRARLTDDQTLVLASSTETGLPGEPWLWDAAGRSDPDPPSFGSRLCRGPRARWRAEIQSKGTR